MTEWTLPPDSRHWVVTITDPAGESHDATYSYHPDCDPIDDFDGMRQAVDIQLAYATEKQLTVEQSNLRRERLAKKKGGL